MVKVMVNATWQLMQYLKITTEGFLMLQCEDRAEENPTRISIRDLDDFFSHGYPRVPSFVCVDIITLCETDYLG